MSDQSKGLCNKYQIIKRETGVEVDGNCFVLRPDRDPAAVAALLRYADATSNADLSADIWQWMQSIAPAAVDGTSEEVYPLLDGTELLVSPGDRVLAVRSRPDGIPITIDPDGIIDDVLLAYGTALVRINQLQGAALAGTYFSDEQLDELGKEYRTVPTDGLGYPIEPEYNSMSVRGDIVKLIADVKTARAALKEERRSLSLSKQAAIEAHKIIKRQREALEKIGEELTDDTTERAQRLNAIIGADMGEGAES
ncbi:hypothetical protein [Paenibacillus durus]|uniref:Uncharacterized protein n=1 Tax=Paenibacillus durus ATCC 35681 TaxID=1333534 RepID=A0A0F7CJF3_PAEDU|nr:hypothetical protein [Paenibacillus durus]AKG36111.1 hypothetical protein VK70_17380 [Paenibacillus durus ATCC 35681]